MPTSKTSRDGISPGGSEYNLRRLFSMEFNQSHSRSGSVESLNPSPLDKPLPPLPSPEEFDVPIVHIPDIVDEPEVDEPVAIASHDGWRQRCASATTFGNWVDSIFADTDISFGPRKSGYAWRLCRKIYEKVHHSPSLTYSSAVYECSQTKGRVRGPKAYMKLYMQVPTSCRSCQSYCAMPVQAPPALKAEIAALKRMCQAGDNVLAPRLLAAKSKPQSKRMWVPGGFLSFVVMQKLPAAALTTSVFWRLPSQTRDEVRKSFKTALESLWKAGVMPQSCAVERLAWNATTKTCYIVDLEGADLIGHLPHWLDDEYFRWGLSRSSSEPCESAFYDDSDKKKVLSRDNKFKLAISRATSRSILRRNHTPSIRLITTTVGG